MPTIAASKNLWFQQARVANTSAAAAKKAADEATGARKPGFDSLSSMGRESLQHNARHFGLQKAGHDMLVRRRKL